jgi:hypothetical protein
MRYLPLILAALFLAACDKDDSQPKVVATPLAPFSCNDTSDDGKFELWNDTVRTLVFGTGPHIYNPDTVVPGYLLNADSVSRNISLSKPEMYIRAVYDTGTAWQWFFAVVDANRGLVEAMSGVDVASHKTKPDTVVEKITLGTSFRAGLTTGCKRIYYFGIKPDIIYNDVSNGHELRGTVLFKGHYDVQVN